MNTDASHVVASAFDLSSVQSRANPYPELVEIATEPHSRLHSPARAVKGRQDAVTGGLDDATVMLSDFRIDELATVWQDAVDMERGELDPNVAFMQGRMKVAGSMGVMIELLVATRTPEYQDLRRRVAAVTQF